MQLLIYTHEFPPFAGGLATTSYKLAKGFHRAGINTTVLAPSYSQEDKYLDNEFDFSVNRMTGLSRNHGVPFPIKEISGFLSFAKYLSHANPDVVLFITREAHIVGGLLGKPNKYNIVVRVAGYEAKRFLLGKRRINNIQALALRKLYTRANKIISPSNSTKQLLIDSSISESKIEVIHNGISREAILRETSYSELEVLRNKFKLETTDKVILTVSRLVPGKGQDKVIEALSRVRHEYNDFKYILVGDGRYKRILKDLVIRNKLQDKVIFVGSVPHEEVMPFYDLCDIFVMVNRTITDKENIEGLPNVLIEAASRAKPIITGMDGGSKEAVEHGKTGYVAEGENIDQIAEYLLELLLNNSKGKDFGLNGKLKMLDQFTEEEMINNYIKIINQF